MNEIYKIKYFIIDINCNHNKFLKLKYKYCKILFPKYLNLASSKFILIKMPNWFGFSDTDNIENCIEFIFKRISIIIPILVLTFLFQER